MVLNAFDLYFSNAEKAKEEHEAGKYLLDSGMRKCKDCKQIKPYDAFFRKGVRATKQQTRSECKICSGIRQKIRRSNGSKW